MAVNPRHIAAQAMQHFKCSKCGRPRGKVCKTNTGTDYPVGTVHAERRDEYLAAHPEALDESASPVVGEADVVQAVTETLPKLNNVEVHVRLESPDEKARRERAERIAMVLGFLKMMVRFDGPDRTLERVAEIFVEYEFDKTMIWESKRADGTA